MDKGVQLLPRAAAAGIKVFGLLQGFHAADRLALGRPTEDYPNWIGELLPDDRQAGKLLAIQLIEQARRRNLESSDGSIRILGLSGPYTVASIARLNGLREAVAADSQAILEEVAPAGWDHARAREQTKSLIVCYPEASVVWAANDAMAFGAIEGSREVGRSPGQEVLVGGIDWSPGVGTLLRNGDLAISIGGHSFDGLWALALLKLHNEGTSLPRRSLSSRLVAMTRDNVGKYEALTERSTWSRIDFPRLLAMLRSGGPDVELSADAALGLLEA
jgi:ABC-type sugar transport system substrate-binding protein